jgi:hypothetical protein
VTTQQFDLTFRLSLAGLGLVSAHVFLDGADVTPALGSCAIFGTLTAGGVTARCPELSGGVFVAGVHTLSASVTLSDGSVIGDSVTWVVDANHEP